MPNSLTPTDVYAIVNSVAAQVLGTTTLTAVDTTSFVTVGETLLRTSTENTLNAISTVLGRTIFANRKYDAKFSILRSDDMRWGAQVRKIVNLPLDAEASEDYNTDINSTQLADGNSIDHYKIKNFKALQLNFYGTKKLQRHFTRYRDQLSLAFRSEDEFARFIDNALIEFSNDIETQTEAEARATVCNYITALEEMNSGRVIDLVAAYNAKFGTSYNATDLQTTYLEDFAKFFAAEVKKYSSKMTDRTNLFHESITGYPDIVRHTPKAKQRMLMFAPLFVDIKAFVYSTIFNPQYLGIGEMEEVNYWQTPIAGALGPYDGIAAITYKPNYLDTATGQSADAANAVSLDCVLGILYDVDAMGIYEQFDYTATTPFNAAGGYTNTYYHWRHNYWNDFTENAVVFVMK